MDKAMMNLFEYVKKMPGHKNSRGESAPWTIVSHKTGKILSSHKTKEEAEKHLQQMHAFKEEVEPMKVKKGLERLADKVSEKTGLEFYSDLQSIDYTEVGNDEGLVDYLLAETDFGFEYLCKYDNGDFEVVIWDDDEETPHDTFRNPSPFAVAKYAIEHTPFKPDER